MKHFISPVLALILTSCAAEMATDLKDGMMPMVGGRVTDMEGNPIEHIQVTLNWGSHAKESVVFTSSEGIFKSEAILAEEGQTSLRITLEDIDGTDNGGQFETLTETVTLYEDEAEDSEGPVRFDLDFRLNHATVSENSPQS